MGLARPDGVAALLADPERIGGLRGSVAALLAVEPGWETAVATALGPAADAVAVESVDDAVAALRGSATTTSGAPAWSSATVDDEGSTLPPLPSGPPIPGRLDHRPARLRPAVTGVLRGVVVVDDLPTARALVGELPCWLRSLRTATYSAATWPPAGRPARRAGWKCRSRSRKRLISWRGQRTT